MKLFPWRKYKAGCVPALFLHIQKTAGTSLISLARQYYDARMIVSHGDYCNVLPERLADVRFVSGHFGYAYARYLMRGRYSFTFLRNPAERLLSFYYFCRSRNPAEYGIFRLAHEHDLLSFMDACLTDPFLRMQIWNNQVWQLAYGYTQVNTRTQDDFSPDKLLKLASQHLGEFSHVGFTETFPADAAIISQALKLPHQAPGVVLPRENVTRLRIALTEQPTEVKTKLARFTELDLELYVQARHTRRAQSFNWLR